MQPPADAPDLHAADLHVPDQRVADQGTPQVPAPREPDSPTGAVSTEEPVATSDNAIGLSEREVQILAFEAKWWKHAGSKEQAVRDTFGLSATRYYQLLNGLLDNPAALEHDPVLVARLRRLRSTRARTRRR